MIDSTLFVAEMKLTEFESAVVEWIADQAGDDALNSQLRKVEVVEREFTGVGCFTRLRIHSEVEKTTESYRSRGPLFGPGFESSIVEHGGMTLLWFSGGMADTLEIVTYTGDFPEDHDQLKPFTLVRG